MFCVSIGVSPRLGRAALLAEKIAMPQVVNNFPMLGLERRDTYIAVSIYTDNYNNPLSLLATDKIFR